MKEGPKLAQLLLDAGANDLGGTLINESISTSAGAQYGQLVGPGRAARSSATPAASRRSATRSTTSSARYETGEDPDSPLDTSRGRRGALRLVSSPHRLGRISLHAR